MQIESPKDPDNKQQFVLAPTPAQLGKAPGQLNHRRQSAGSASGDSSSPATVNPSNIDNEQMEEVTKMQTDSVSTEQPLPDSIQLTLKDESSPKRPILKRSVEDGMDK